MMKKFYLKIYWKRNSLIPVLPRFLLKDMYEIATIPKSQLIGLNGSQKTGNRNSSCQKQGGTSGQGWSIKIFIRCFVQFHKCRIFRKRGKFLFFDSRIICKFFEILYEKQPPFLFNGSSQCGFTLCLIINNIQFSIKDGGKYSVTPIVSSIVENVITLI